MKNNLNMPIRRYIIYLILISASCFISDITAQISDYGDFPYQKSLMDGQQSDMEFPTAQKATTPNSADFIEGLGLRLTPSPANQYSFGAVFVDKRRFSSDVGIHIEFEYMMYGGTGGDGLCMFLFDAAVDTPVIGAHGAGIGYAFNRSYNGKKTIQGQEIDFRPYRMTGLTGAYLGISLDEFGNNKGIRFQSDARIGGVPYSGTVYGTTRGMVHAKYNTKNQITLRGAKGPVIDASLGMGDGYTGYPVLITQSTNNTDSVNNTNDRPGFELDITLEKPLYKQIKSYKGNLFKLSGGDVFTNPLDTAYRKAIIELFPAPKVNNQSDGFLITVSIQHGRTTDVIISDYHYKEAFQYGENAYPDGGQGDNNPGDIVRLEPVYRPLDASIPDYLRIGFAASTGKETNIHVIKNLNIRLPRSAEANDDFAETDQSVPVSLMPLENDLAYDGEIKKIQEGKPEYIDVNTFRFRDINNNIISGSTHTDSDGNTWTFSYENVAPPMDRTVKVTLTPNPSFFGEAKIKYDILGGRYTATPYSDAAYRSVPATITVNVKKSAVVYRNTISNKMVTIKLNQ